MGHRLASPRLTAAGFAMMLKYFAAPLMAAMIALDLVLYVFFRYGFGICYGVWCWF